MPINTNPVKFLSLRENISATNGFYFANPSTLIQEQPDGSKLRYYDCDGVFTYQANEFSHEQVMTPVEAEKFVKDFVKLDRPGWKKIALNMEKQLETLKKCKISYPQMRLGSISVELQSQSIQISLKNDEEIIIKQLTLNTKNNVFKWVEIKDENKIKKLGLKEDIRIYITTLKSNLKPTDKNYGLLTNMIDRLFIKYMELYG